jgi:hypothetical protein
MSAIATTAVQRIQTLADELFNMGNTALEKVNEAGRLLTECKGGLAHGQWLPWLEENFTFTDRTARRWMKLHEDIVAGRLKSDTVSGLAEAYKLTTEPRFGATDKASAPAPRPAPASSKPPLPLGATYQDAEIVEPSAPDIEPEYEYDEAAIRLAAEHSVTPAEVVAAGEFHSATTRLSVLENKIEDGISKLKSEGMILPTVLSMLPHLTKSEIKSLIETLNTRWT